MTTLSFAFAIFRLTYSSFAGRKSPRSAPTAAMAFFRRSRCANVGGLNDPVRTTSLGLSVVSAM